MLETYCQQVSDVVQTKYGFTIPWELIIEAVLEMINKCLDEQTEFVEAAQHPTVLQKIAINLHVRRVLDSPSRAKIQAVSNSLFEVAAGLNSEQLAGAFAEAQAVLQIGE
jgi:hypothetical protein